MHSSIIVCYNPSIDKLNELCNLILDESSKLILVDNSDKQIQKEEFNINGDFELISLGKNLGIAAAQNIGAKYAFEQKSEYVTFFDQDSMIKKSFIKTLISLMEKANSSIGAPLAIDSQTAKNLPALRLNKYGLPYQLKFNDNDEPKIADIVISSGTTIKIDVFDQVGLFDESLFIDQVDTDWCLRCKKMGLGISVFPEVKMLHNIGTHRKKFGPFTVQIHNSERCYYQIRNSIYLIRKRHVPFLFIVREIASTTLNRFFLLFFIKGKMKYIKKYIKGFIDGVFRKMGPYSH